MAPEQRTHRSSDARADQFSFCVAVWEALDGARPFGRGSSSEVLVRIARGDLPPFRNREVPRRIVTALRRGLAWAPEDRHADMATLLAALEPQPQTRRRRQLLAASAALPFLLAFGWSRPDSHQPGEVDQSCERDARDLDGLWTPSRRARISKGVADADRSWWARCAAAIDAWTSDWAAAAAEGCSGSGEQQVAARACLSHAANRFELLVDLMDGDPSLAGALGPLVHELPDPGECRGRPDSEPIEPAGT